MIVQILIVLAILAAAGVVLGMTLGSRDSRGGGLLSEAVEAWRSEDRQLDEFDVTMRDTSVGDVFTAFPEDTSAYVTPETVEGQINRVVGAEKEVASHVKPVVSKIVHRGQNQPPEADGTIVAEERAGAEAGGDPVAQKTPPNEADPSANDRKTSRPGDIPSARSA